MPFITDNDATTLIHTDYFPMGHVVADPNMSWFMCANPLHDGQPINFDVGLHLLTTEEPVTLIIEAYLDLHHAHHNILLECGMPCCQQHNRGVGGGMCDLPCH